MVRKKNKMFVDSADRTPHYSLRKLSVGVASVLLSTTLWMGANGSVVHADTGTINNNATETVVGKASSSDGTKQAEPAEQATGQAPGKESNASTDTTDTSAVADVDNAKTKGEANETASANAASNKIVMARVMPSPAGTVSASGEKNTADNQNHAGTPQLSENKATFESHIYK